jgi:hypothetical protein
MDAETEMGLRWVKLAMALAGLQAGYEMWEAAKLPGELDFDELAAVRIVDDDDWGDREWDEMFRPMEPA